MRPRAAALASGLLLAASSASCAGGGGDPPRAPLDSAFRARVDAACDGFLAAQQAHPFPVKDFDPHKPDPAKLPAVATYFGTYRPADVVVEGVTALGEPAQNASTWDDLRGVLEQDAANAKVQIRTAAAKDVAAFTKSVDRAEVLHARLVSLAEDLGFDDGSSCARYFD
jgi:hypothetical protein